MVPVVSPVGSPPSFSNIYVLFWSLFNFAILIAIPILIIWIIWYVKKKSDYRKQLIQRMDLLITLLQDKQSDQQ